MFKNKASDGQNNICGKRFVTDIELVCFAQILNVSLDELLKE